MRSPDDDIKTSSRHRGQLVGPHISTCLFPSDPPLHTLLSLSFYLILISIDKYQFIDFSLCPYGSVCLSFKISLRRPVHFSSGSSLCLSLSHHLSLCLLDPVSLSPPTSLSLVTRERLVGGDRERLDPLESSGSSLSLSPPTSLSLVDPVSL